LFVVLANAVLESLGEPFDGEAKLRRYERAKSFYRGDGWFSDGPEPKFDYYNAWAFHYTLFWIRKIDPTWDRAFIDAARRTFVASYKYFFGRHGFPVMGRSVCYRMAAPTPVIGAHVFDPDVVTPGEARRALDLTWSHFVRRGAVARGMVTQGYYGTDVRLLDSYSGPASCLWSLRSLVVAFHLDDESEFWRTGGSPLPVEIGDFCIELPVLGRRLIGTSANGDVRLVSRSSTERPEPPVERYALRDMILDVLLTRGRRPANTAAKYERREYGSLQPFCAEPRKARRRVPRWVRR
jgi:hypothetical protein